MSEEMFTASGWKFVDPRDIGDEGCCDCDRPAETITRAGRGIFWAQCLDCSDESAAEGRR